MALSEMENGPDNLVFTKAYAAEIWCRNFRDIPGFRWEKVNVGR